MTLKIITTHPIQYQVPIWKELARRNSVPFEVIFLCDHGYRESYDKEFGASFRWDMNMLEGYPSRVVGGGRSPVGFWSLRLSTEIIGYLWRERPNVVWIQGWQVAGYWGVAFLARLRGADLWLRAETNSRSGGGRVAVARKIALRALFSLTDRFFWIGAGNRDFYLSQGVQPERLAFAPYCVDNDTFHLAAKTNRCERESVKRELKLPPRAFCFLFVGKFIAKKRPIDILDAAELAARIHPAREFHLIWVGGGEQEEALRARSRTCLENSGVASSFLGFLNQSEISKAYGVADCLILPSDASETWGLVVNEAMASGLPAIVSDACGCAQDLRLPGRDDLTYPCGDTRALANSMCSVMTQPPEADAIRRKVADYDFRRTVDAVEALYTRVAAREARRM